MACPTPSIIPAKLDARPFRALCKSNYTPLQLTGIIQLWLTLHFADPNNVKMAGLQNYIWDADPEVSKVLIAPIELWKPVVTEQRPAIIIKRNELKFVRLGIDNRLQGGGGIEATKRHYVAEMSGSHSVMCIGGDAGETEQLAAEVAQEIAQFAPVVREWLNFIRIELVSQSELSKIEEAAEHFVVAVNVAYAYFANWKIAELDSPIVQGIKVVLGT